MTSCRCDTGTDVTPLEDGRGYPITIDCDMTKRQRVKIALKLVELSDYRSVVFEGFKVPKKDSGFNPWNNRKKGYDLPFDDEEYFSLVEPINETIENIGNDVKASVEGDKIVMHPDWSNHSPKFDRVSIDAIICHNCKSVSFSAPDYVIWKKRTDEYLFEISNAMDTLKKIGILTAEIRNEAAEEKKRT